MIAQIQHTTAHAEPRAPRTASGADGQPEAEGGEQVTAGEREDVAKWQDSVEDELTVNEEARA